MDFDGVVERKGNIIIFETKDVGVRVPVGQAITLRAIWHRGGITVMFVYGKCLPETCYWWYPKNNSKPKLDGPVYGVDEAKDFVKRWFQFSDRNPYYKSEHV